MKCLVFSDSHGSGENILRAIRMHPDASYAFFLGDGIRDVEGVIPAAPELIWYAVRGNCDFSPYLNGELVKKTEELVLEGHRIVLTHGDLYGAKYGMSGLVSLAEERICDIVLYGHTHVPREDYLSVSGRGVWFFNPGSVGSSFSDSGTFGILTLEGDTVLFSHKKF